MHSAGNSKKKNWRAHARTAPRIRKLKSSWRFCNKISSVSCAQSHKFSSIRRRSRFLCECTSSKRASQPASQPASQHPSWETKSQTNHSLRYSSSCVSLLGLPSCQLHLTLQAKRVCSPRARYPANSMTFSFPQHDSLALVQQSL